MSAHKLGIKLWSTNISLSAHTLDIYKKQLINYIELYIVPGTYHKYINTWKSLEVPYIIHAPNESILDISQSKNLIENLTLFNEVQQYANELHASHIIVHPGSGDLNQNIQQLRSFSDNRILIENMPLHSLHDGSKLNGSEFQDIKQFLLQTKYGLCLDIGHAIVAAHNLNIDYSLFIDQLIGLNSKMYHLNDGLTNGSKDSHMSFGKGDFPLQQIMRQIPSGAKITLETPKIIDGGNLSDFVKDVKYIQNL